MNRETAGSVPQLKENEIKISDLAPGKAKMVSLGSDKIAVYNCNGHIYATQELCTHRRGPLHEGTLNGCVIQCPWHGSRFDVTTGAVVRGPATQPIKTYAVIVEGDVARVENHA